MRIFLFMLALATSANLSNASSYMGSSDYYGYKEDVKIDVVNQNSLDDDFITDDNPRNKRSQWKQTFLSKSFCVKAVAASLCAGALFGIGIAVGHFTGSTPGTSGSGTASNSTTAYGGLATPIIPPFLNTTSAHNSTLLDPMSRMNYSSFYSGDFYGPITYECSLETSICTEEPSLSASFVVPIDTNSNQEITPPETTGVISNTNPKPGHLHRLQSEIKKSTNKITTPETTGMVGENKECSTWYPPLKLGFCDASDAPEHAYESENRTDSGADNSKAVVVFNKNSQETSLANSLQSKSSKEIQICPIKWTKENGYMERKIDCGTYAYEEKCSSDKIQRVIINPNGKVYSECENNIIREHCTANWIEKDGEWFLQGECIALKNKDRCEFDDIKQIIVSQEGTAYPECYNAVESMRKCIFGLIKADGPWKMAGICREF